MRIQKISSYPVYNRSQKQNKLNTANVSTPPCQPQKPSFKKLIDGVKDKEMMWFDEGIPNADFSIYLDRKRKDGEISRRQKDIIMKALAIAKPKIDEITKAENNDGMEYNAEVHVNTENVFETTFFNSFPEPIPLWWHSVVQFHVCPNYCAELPIVQEYLNLRKDVRKLGDDDKVAADIAKKMIDYAKFRVDTIPKRLVELAKKDRDKLYALDDMDEYYETMAELYPDSGYMTRKELDKEIDEFFKNHPNTPRPDYL